MTYSRFAWPALILSVAININVQSEDFASLLANLDRDKTYLVRCTRNPENGRSSRALETLPRLGLTNLLSLQGGYAAWKEADLALTEAGNWVSAPCRSDTAATR